MYRSSTGNLAQFEDPPVRGERWDREKFERMSRHGGGRDEHDHFRFEEHDRLPKGGSRDIELDERFDRRGARVVERERFHEDERFPQPRRHRADFLDEPTASELASRALAPYRRKSIIERDVGIAVRRPARPQFLRRQSSLDTFDRRPLPKYSDLEREEWRPPANVPIPLPIRERRRSPSRRGFREGDYEEVRFRDIDREPRGEEYREVEVRREKSRRRRSRSRAARSIAQSSVRSSSSSSFEEVSPVRSTVGRKGKTRMPKRLVRKQAVIELGYPFEEEDDFIIVRRALEKEQIDEIIKISENYKDEKTTYVYEERREVEHAPPPLPPPEVLAPLPPPPPPPSVHHHHPAPSVHYSQSVRGVSPSRHGHEVFEERIEESNHICGPLTVLVPEERRIVRSERDIKDEIRLLEAERRMLKYEREGDFEIIERREPRREVVRVEKDRKGRLALVRSAH
ncbi:uncharacterized protein BDR25DRAFT_211982 [Lindgomyces ingoldianus]|uniref:Uncharacterized protein n=1 Tax=Lindgomyces ingoldianus TaxID=673940 RepID=A0ACB6RAL6_9PLEO|nr:uncharacterized protein BDR25DRAFT_211982 [Lindgomyces ingoldianus]KAF2475808.1 hypothetical protein BDR25DRAFT_211982 [Lindgomyces ingoldianus]